MRVDLEAVVRTQDGENAGDVRPAVFDPQTGDVEAFVIHSETFLGRDILVPRAEIEQTRSTARTTAPSVYA